MFNKILAALQALLPTLAALWRDYALYRAGQQQGRATAESTHHANMLSTITAAQHMRARTAAAVQRLSDAAVLKRLRQRWQQPRGDAS